MTSETRGSCLGSAIAIERAAKVAELCLGPDMDREAAERLVLGASQAREHASAVILDARAKGFVDLDAQRVVSLAKDQLSQWQRAAVWLRPEQREAARGYLPAGVGLFDDPADPDAPSWVRERHQGNREKLHLIAGSTGAGKSTYALRIVANLGAFYAAIDDWMEHLFGPDRPADAGFDWFMPRVLRCEEHILRVAEDLARLAQPSVLDLGLTTRVHRQRILEWAKARGLSVQLHFVDAPAERRWQRVERRNRDRGETFRLEVTREMFDFVEGMFEAPGADEHDDFVHVMS